MLVCVQIYMLFMNLHVHANTHTHTYTHTHTQTQTNKHTRTHTHTQTHTHTNTHTHKHTHTHTNTLTHNISAPPLPPLLTPNTEADYAGACDILNPVVLEKEKRHLWGNLHVYIYICIMFVCVT